MSRPPLFIKPEWVRHVHLDFDMHPAPLLRVYWDNGAGTYATDSIAIRGKVGEALHRRDGLPRWRRDHRRGGLNIYPRWKKSSGRRGGYFVSLEFDRHTWGRTISMLRPEG